MTATEYQPRRPAWSRTLAEAVALPTRMRVDPGVSALAADVPQGEGAVLVLPSSLCGDWQTVAIRAFLEQIGYMALPWDLGINLGPTPKVVSALPERLVELARAHGPVNLLGFSMGGLFARWLGVRAPELVRSVTTVCSPFRRPTDSVFLPLDPVAKAWWGPELWTLADEMARPLTGPATFIYTREDGIVAWESCCDAERAEDNLEVHGPHVAIAQNLDVFRIVAERLAQALSP